MSDLEKAINILKEHYSAWEKCADRLTSGYEYERSYATMMQEVEQQIFAVSVGEPPKDRNRKKNSIPDLGK